VVATLHRETPSTATKGSRPMRDKCKRKVVDSTKAEQSYKFKAYPFMMKEALEIEAMR